jgi:glycine betaine/proline transport system permease protein
MGIVILAIVLDRITQGMAEKAKVGRLSLRQSLVNLFRLRGSALEGAIKKAG